MREQTPKITGRLHLTVRRADGGIACERRARNLVVRGGAEAVARRVAGKEDAEPINRIRVGFATEAADVEVTALTPPEGESDPAALETEITADQFSVDATQTGFVRLAIASVFTPTVDLKNVTEAGLFAGERLYNQVVFEPVTLLVGQDVTFFWEVDFPFGR